MADVATPPAAEATQGKQQIVKPEKPDEDKYKEDLAKAEKEHAAAQEKLVSHLLLWALFYATTCARSHASSRREAASHANFVPPY
jgi:hypothetical protein